MTKHRLLTPLCLFGLGTLASLATAAPAAKPSGGAPSTCAMPTAEQCKADPRWSSAAYCSDAPSTPAGMTKCTPAQAKLAKDPCTIKQAARDHGASRTVQALMYPMGTVAKRIAAFDAIAASALRMQLREGLEGAVESKEVIAALAGLGNAGYAEDLSLVLEHEHDAEPGARGAVASALRMQPGPDATAALLRLVADDEMFVAQVALTAIEQRRIDEHGVSRLGGLALGGGYPEELAEPLTSALLRHVDEDPTVRVALLAMRSRAVDPSKRERIDANLGAG